MVKPKDSEDEYLIWPMGRDLRVFKNRTLIADRLLYGINETDSPVDLATVMKKEMPFCGPMARKAIYGMLTEKERGGVYADPSQNTSEAIRKRALSRVGLNITDNGQIINEDKNMETQNIQTASRQKTENLRKTSDSKLESDSAILIVGNKEVNGKNCFCMDNLIE